MLFIRRCVNVQRPGDVIITLVAKQFFVESSPFSESLGRKYCAGTVLKKKSFNSLLEFRLFCCQSIIGKYAATHIVTLPLNTIRVWSEKVS